jgi:hypothetical protein
MLNLAGMAYLQIIFRLLYLIEHYQLSFLLVLEMKRMVKDMLEEVDSIDRNNSVCEDLYGKLE